MSGHHYGLPPEVRTSAFETGWPRTYLQRKPVLPGLTIHNKWIYVNVFINLAAAGVIVFSLIWLTQKIGVPKLRDYFILLTITAILIVIGARLGSAGDRFHLETTIQLACVVPVLATIVLSVVSVLGKWQNKTVTPVAKLHSFDHAD